MKERAHWRFARIFVLLAVVVALLAMLGMAGFAAEADTAERECYLSGDLNGDGDLTPKDAIYALYSGFFGQESYPISQDWDYDANGKHNSRDAIELLYACYGMSDKVSTDMVHDYHDPVWSWNDAGDTISVSVTFKCGCQDAFIVTGTTEGAELTLRELEEQRVEAGCLTCGQRVYQAAVSYKGKESTSEPYTVTVAPTGHSTGDMVKVEGQPDYHGKFCSACESYVGVAEHNWKENGTVESAMPCFTPNQHYHLCQICGDKVDIATHDFGEPVITREPTCKEHGSQSSFCAVCGFEKTQDLLPSGKHTFVNGVCVDCGTAENDCDHTELYPSQFDISGFDMCQGTQLILHSCPCGAQMGWQYFTDCDWTFLGEKDPETGASMRYCENCGKYYDASTGAVGDEITADDLVLEALGHSHGSEWVTDAAGHWHSCSCGDKADYAEHTPETVGAEAPAVGKPGYTGDTVCSVCGYKIAEGEQIPAETTAPATTVPPTTQAPATQPGEEPGNGGAFWWILVILAAAAAAVAAWLLLGKRKKA